MDVVISYHSLLEGHTVRTEDEQGNVRFLAVLNGNCQDRVLPVVLYSLDAHVVYAMSHPAVISRSLTSSPQVLLTSRDLAHRLFEHGMKAALHRVMMGSSPVLATLDTYYKLSVSAGPISVKVHSPSGSVALVIRKEILGSNRDFVIAGRGFPDSDPTQRLVYFEDLTSCMTVFKMEK